MRYKVKDYNGRFAIFDMQENDFVRDKFGNVICFGSEHLAWYAANFLEVEI